ncbi:hypothetical protein PQX77_016963 [Marasmius sp. AFHP31]|nr:hypothetical protein PQX77_016963 [Marasmius sp. AFHP31]
MSIRQKFLKGLKAAALDSSDQSNSRVSTVSTSSSFTSSSSSRAASVETSSRTSDASGVATDEFFEPADGFFMEPDTPSRPSSLSRHGGFDTVNLDGSVSPSPVLPASFINLRKRLTTDLPDDTPRMTKRIKEHTEKTCKDANLNTPLRAAVEKFSQLDDRQRKITLYVEIQSVKALVVQRAQQEVDITERRLKDQLAEAKSKVNIQLTVCLLSPDISYYIRNVNKAVMGLIGRKPELFKVTKELLNNQEYYASLCSYVIVQLAQTRSSIKNKLYSSMGLQKRKKGQQAAPGLQTINILATPLASTVQGMEVGGGHWARFAYLRACCVAFNLLLKKQKGGAPTADPVTDNEDDASEARKSSETTSTSSRIYKDTEYWTFVDHQLKGLRAETLKEANRNRTVAAILLSQFFTRVLQEDLQTYNAFPTGEEIDIRDVDYTPVGATWQREIGQAMVFPTGASTS